MLVFTSCANNYIPKARVLARSLKAHNPGWEFCLVLAERPPDDFRLEREPFDRLLLFSELGIENYKAWLFRHRVVEICTAAKGPALNFFLEKEGREKVIYLDPDIMVLDSLAPLEDMLDRHDILLTPHQLAPQKTHQAIIDNEICSLRHGIYNLGFIACASRPEGLEFSRFWRDRLYSFCYDDKERGLFTDQRWCDLAPAYFASLGIVRDPGCNAASWNLTDRTLSCGANGRYAANGKPLRFYHFTGYDSGMGRIMSSIYGARMPAVAQLWEEYGQKLEAAGHDSLKKLRWSGEFFDNGEKISDEMRCFYRDNPDVQALFPDPYETDAKGQSGFPGYWKELTGQRRGFLRVWGGKPLRLARLTGKYLSRHGGLGGVPSLALKVARAFRQGGIRGVIARARAFKANAAAGAPALSLDQLLKPRNQTLAQWLKLAGEAFSGKNGVLVLDHMYGGGANDYREKRIEEFLAAGRPTLLATWDFFNNSLKARIRLPGAAPRSLAFETGDLRDLLNQDVFHFGKVLINELVLWSNSSGPNNHHNALPGLVDVILKLRQKDGASLELALHDYYSLCPSYNLLENDRKFCDLPADSARCRACLAKSRFDLPENFDLSAWRAAWGRIYEAADEIRAFSRTSLDLARRVHAIPDAKARVVPHEPLLNFGTLYTPPAGAPMKIAVIGHIASHKGAALVAELAGLLEGAESLVVVGRLDDVDATSPRMTVLGDYRREDLPRILAEQGVTVGLIPSIWPETFCYTAQEAMQLGLPTVVFPLGAQGERVGAWEHGLCAEGISAEAALKALRQLDGRRENS